MLKVEKTISSKLAEKSYTRVDIHKSILDKYFEALQKLDFKPATLKRKRKTKSVNRPSSPSKVTIPLVAFQALILL